MSMFFALLKTDLRNTYSLNRLFSRSKRMKKLSAKGPLAAIFALAVLAIWVFYIYTLFSTYVELLSNAIFVLFGVIAIGESVTTFIYTIRMAPVHLFSFKDYDLLMSMPFKPVTVLLEKVVKLYVGNLLLTYAVFGPMLVAIGTSRGDGPLYYVASLLLLFFVPMLPILVGTLIGGLFMWISSKFRKTNLVNMIFSFLFILLIMVFSMGIGGLSGFAAESDMEAIVEMDFFWDILEKYPPALLFTKALDSYDVLSGAIFLGINLAAFAIFVLIFTRGFNKINLALRENQSKSNYTFRRQEVSGAFSALFRNERRRYFSSFVYVYNTASGPIVGIIFLVMMVFLGNTVLPELLDTFLFDELKPFIAGIMAALLIFSLTIAPTTAATISYEGKAFWLTKTMPVPVERIYWSKICVNFLIPVPITVAISIASHLLFRLELQHTLAILLIGLLCIILTSFTGLYINLHFPKMNWSTPNQAIKNSLSVFVSVFVGFGLVLLAGLGYFLFVVKGFIFGLEPFTGTLPFMYGFALFLVVLCAGIWILLRTNGKKLFDAIEA